MSRIRPLDAVLALAAFGFALVLLLREGVGPDGAYGDAFALLLAALSTLPLVVWRTFPLGVYVLAMTSSGVLATLDPPNGPPIGGAVALFLLASVRTQVRASGGALAIVILGLFAAHFVAFAVSESVFPSTELLLGSTLWAAAWFAGDRTRLRRERIRELEERAIRAEREAERERKLAAAEERTRIARDLHDSAGHAINVILVHAGAARLLAEKDPSRSQEALGTIEAVARETLREIDSLVRHLRKDDEEFAPPASLSAVDRLLERHREAGLEVDVSIEGDRRRLSPAVDQAAYRILQESLTNALRHGDGAASVAIAYGDDALGLSVTNPAGAANGAGAGHGLIGMRERAAALDGSVEAGSVDGVFSVRARLPYGKA
jgi:signal transduction histidine kinase